MRSLIEFTRQVVSGKRKEFSLKDFPLEEPIQKDGGILEVLKPNLSIPIIFDIKFYFLINLLTLCGA